MANRPPSFPARLSFARSVTSPAPEATRRAVPCTAIRRYGSSTNSRSSARVMPALRFIGRTLTAVVSTPASWPRAYSTALASTCQHPAGTVYGLSVTSGRSARMARPLRSQALA